MKNPYDEVIDQLIAIRKNEKDFEDSDNILYQRTTYSPFRGRLSYSKWRILLDESKTKWCIKSARGFQIVSKQTNDEIVTAPSNIKDLLLAPSVKDREVAQIMLNQIADKKYGRTNQ